MGTKKKVTAPTMSYGQTKPGNNVNEDERWNPFTKDGRTRPGDPTPENVRSGG